MKSKKDNSSAPPHVLVLYCDQMQHDRMGFMDGTAHTPNLDALAEEGVHFTHAITCHGQCVPSRAAFMTGRSAHEAGVMVNYGFSGDKSSDVLHQNKITPNQWTLGREFRKNGYETAYIGKSHLGTPLEELGFDLGMENDDVHIDDEEARSRGIEHVPPRLRNQYASADDAVQFLQNWTPGEKPMFFVFSTNLPHPPFFTEPKYADRFPPEDMKLPPSFHRETFEGKPAYQKAHVEDGDHGIDDEAYARQMIRDYYSMIAMMDEHVGRVISEYKRLGIWENTLVLFMADHGDMMSAHRMYKKGTLPYDELYRVPCIFKLPQEVSSERGVINDLVSSLAFAGTLVELAGLELPEAFTGGSFAEAFHRRAHPEQEEVYFEHYAAYWGLHPFYGVRTRRWKYVRYYGADDTEELYDLENDPDELCNLAGRPDPAPILDDLAGRADRWWRETGGRDVAYYESESFKRNLHNQNQNHI